MTTVEVHGGIGVCDQDRTEELGEQLRKGAADLAAAEYRWLVALEEFDRLGGWGEQGARTCAHWLSWACGLGIEAARERLRVARALPSLPAVSAAFAEGRLTYSKVRAITRVATPGNEALLASYGLCSTASQLERVVREHRRAEDADDVEQLGARQHSLAWRTRDDGWVRFTVDVPPDEAAALIARVNAEVDALGEDVAPPAVPDDRWTSEEERRSLAEAGAPEAATVGDPVLAPEPVAVRRAEALVRMVQTARPSDGPDDDSHRVVVHVRADEACRCGGGDEANGREPTPSLGDDVVDLAFLEEMTDDEALQDPDTATAWASCALAALRRASSTGAYLADGTAVPSETARRLACDAQIITLVEDALGMPLGVGRRTRKIPRRLRRALTTRDGGCRFPSCTATRWVDAHHVVFWGDGGETELENLVLLCRHHHRLVHEAGYEVRAHGDQRFTFHRPDGTRLPDAAPPVRGDAAAPAADNEAAGLDITADYPIPYWDGSPPDYDTALVLLWQATHCDLPDGGVSAEPLHPSEWRNHLSWREAQEDLDATRPVRSARATEQRGDVGPDG